MKYINAKDLLPAALVKELQRYVQGGYLYVPTEQAQQNDGEKSPVTGRNYSSETIKSQRSFGMGPLWRSWRKNTSCLYRPFVKSFIKNEPAGVAGMQPCFCIVYKLIPYHPVDRNGVAAVVLYK